MTLSLAMEQAAYLCEVRLEAWDDALHTLADIRRDYPDEARRIFETIAHTIEQETVTA